MAPTPRNTLSVTDNRTGQTYTVPISADNSIDATAFKAMKAKPGEGEREENETEQGLRVYDPSYLNTAVVRSQITYIDGERGILRYRGYPIEQLAEHSTFLETAYLILYGELPTRAQFEFFSAEVMHHSALHTNVERLLGQFNDSAHPMSVLSSGFAALSAFAPEANPALQGQTLYSRASSSPPDMHSLSTMDKQIYRLIGKAISLAAASYRVRQGRPLNKPPHGLSYTGTFLYLLDYLNEEEYKPNPVFERALDVLFLLHADHEMNASAASVLQVSSSLVDPYSAVAAGCESLYGPTHGGANEAVIRMLTRIGSPENVPEYIEKVKRKEAVLSGFGHRIYRKSDPRSLVIRKVAEDVFAVTGKNPLLKTAMALHDAALKDDYFVKRRLYPNVDFWSGLIYSSLGFPTDFMVVLFAIPRVVGWLAHWRQMMLNPTGVKIWRPRQLYVGAGVRDYVAMDERKDKNPEDPKAHPSTVGHATSTRQMLASYKNKVERQSRL